VLGDIVASSDQIEPLIERFLLEHKRAVFCQASQQLAQRLVDRGFYANEMGTDTTIDLADYNFNGKQKEWLRYASNWCTRRDYRIVEASFDEVHPDEVETVSEAWRKTRTVKQKEVRFLNRPIVLEDEPTVVSRWSVDWFCNLHQTPTPRGSDLQRASDHETHHRKATIRRPLRTQTRIITDGLDR